MSRTCLLLLLLFSATSFSSENKSSKSDKWYRKTLTDFGTFYFGFSNEMGSLHSLESNFWGFDLGMLITPKESNDKVSFIIGLGGSWLDNGIVSDLAIDANTNLSYPLHTKFGGLRVGMLFFKDNLIQPSFDVLVAAGDLQYQIPEATFKKYEVQVESQIEDIVVVMPKINLEIKVAKYFKFGWGFSYRIVKGIDVPWSSNDDASDFGYHGLFKFGNF